MRVRETLSRHTPVHITLRTVKAVGVLRRRRAYHAIRQALRRTWRREDFRVVHISIQREHIHLLCEAADKMALAHGMQSFEISATKRLNAAIARERREKVARRGTVFPERYHVEQLTTPRQVRNAIAYVLNNWRRHGEDYGVLETAQIDPYASGLHFDGWKGESPSVPGDRYWALETIYPQTWLLAEGWRRHGRIDPHEVPGPIARRPSAN